MSLRFRSRLTSLLGALLMAGSSLFPDPIVRLVAGVDEAGRGPPAGPVAVAS